MVPFLNGTDPAAVATLSVDGKEVVRSDNATGVTTDVRPRSQRYELGRRHPLYDPRHAIDALAHVGGVRLTRRPGPTRTRGVAL